MKTLKISLIAFTLVIASAGCEELLNTADTLTESEVIDGLKTALTVGTDSSVFLTSRVDGYYRDEAIKILLPPEADIIYENKDNILFTATGLDQKIEDAVVALNRAAEDAATEAGPIFKTAITDMSISDAWAILNGTNPASGKKTAEFDSTAATNYLISTTYTQLRDAFSPKVNTSLDKKLIGTYSPNQMWSTLTTNYNSVANKSFGLITPMENTDLGAYVTEKALDGLFSKVAKQEKEIRKDPLKWAATTVGDILDKVFGSN